MADKTFLSSSSKTKKEFSYAKGETNLNFTLRNDIKQELKDFVEILEAALRDVREEIGNVGKKIEISG